MGWQCQHPLHISLGSMLLSRRILLSSYANVIDTELHRAMFLISGCLQPTQFSWMPVLSNVAPPSLRCKAATGNMLQIMKPVQIGLCMLMSFSIHLHGLHLDTQYGQT